MIWIVTILIEHLWFHKGQDIVLYHILNITRWLAWKGTDTLAFLFSEGDLVPPHQMNVTEGAKRVYEFTYVIYLSNLKYESNSNPLYLDEPWGDIINKFILKEFKTIQVL